MAANVGRTITIGWGSDSPQETLTGIREKSVALSGEPIDVTSDDDAGWRSLLTVAAEKQVEISVSGVTKDAALLADWFAATVSQVLTFTYTDGATISGTFFMSSYQQTGTYNEAITFEGTFMSSGAITYTPAA